MLPCWWVGEGVGDCVCVCGKCEYCNVVVIVGNFDRVRSPTNVSVMQETWTKIPTRREAKFRNRRFQPTKTPLMMLLE